MKDREIRLTGPRVTLRLLTPADADAYFHAGFDPMDPEVKRFTGTRGEATRASIRAYVERTFADESRYDFLILDRQGNLLGESVLNELDEDTRCANFRICLFDSGSCGRGVGGEAIELTLRFAFETWGLHRVELDVYDYNPRAYAAYLRAGFREEGRRRDGAVWDGVYYDDILMAILAEEYRGSKN